MAECCDALTRICDALKHIFAADRRDFWLDGQSWKSAYATPACACLDPKTLLCTRAMIAFTWFCCVIWSFVSWADGFDIGYYFTKLTHWVAVAELVYFVFAAFTTYMAMYGPVEDGTDSATPWFVRATWFLFSFVPVASFAVFALYWVLVYSGGAIEAIDVVMHGGNFGLVLLDFLIIQQPFYYAHVYMPIIFAAIYSLFTLVYYLAGGTNEDGTSPWIYKAVDWSGNPGGTTSLLGLIVLVGVPIIYSALFCMCGQVCGPVWRNALRVHCASGDPDAHDTAAMKASRADPKAEIVGAITP